MRFSYHLSRHLQQKSVYIYAHYNHFAQKEEEKKREEVGYSHQASGTSGNVAIALLLAATLASLQILSGERNNHRSERENHREELHFFWGDVLRMKSLKLKMIDGV